MNEFFLPYEGKKPFLFISYAHLDSADVLPVIRCIHERKYRLWYDEGIPAGSDWPKNIASHMELCSGVLFFVSEFSLASPNCYNEIERAAKLGKTILCVYLEPVELNDKWNSLLAERRAYKTDPAAIRKARQTRITVENTPDKPDPFAEKMAETILHDPFVTNVFLGDGRSDGTSGSRGGRVNLWIAAILLGVLLLAASAAGTVGLNRGWFQEYFPTNTPTLTATPTLVPSATPTLTQTPTAWPTLEAAWENLFVTNAEFEDELSERAVRKALGQDEGNISTLALLDIKALHICGNMVLRNGNGIARRPDGTCTVNSAPVIKGSVNSLSLYSDMENLTELTLAEQNISSVSPLSDLIRLEKLNLSGSPLKSIQPLATLESLRTLDISHTSVSDLTPLNVLNSLTVVYVSPEMFPLAVDPETQQYEIMLVQ